MTDARILPAPGKLVDLTSVPDGPPAPVLVQLLETLWGVVRPLGADVVTEDANWFLRAGDAPPWVEVRPTVGLVHRVVEVEELTPRALEEVLARDPSAVGTLGVYYARARRSDAREELSLSDDEQDVPVPAERRVDGVWVSGPFADVPVPVGVNCYEQWGQLNLRVTANWSLWTEPGRPEREQLIGVLRSLLAQGWRRSEVDDLGL